MTRIKAAVCHEFANPCMSRISTCAHLKTMKSKSHGCRRDLPFDISFANGDWGVSCLRFMGTRPRACGSAVGDNVRGLDIGDHVVVTLIRACGHCSNCSGAPTICETPGWG